MNKLIFISHREKDDKIAELLIDFILSSIEIEEKEILCTSVPGHMLDFGKSISEQLKDNVNISTVVFALLTSQSLESRWVLFELGASWALGKLLVPVLAPGLSLSDLPGPLKDYPCIQIDKKDVRSRLNEAMKLSAKKLNVSSKPTARSERDLDKFINAFGANSSAPYVKDIDGKTERFICNSHEAVNASDVYVAGSFNNWLNADKGKIKPHVYYRLDRVEKDGMVVWEKDILIPFGPHDFKFVVGDNYWVHWTERSGYNKGSDAPGGPNFRVVVD